MLRTLPFALAAIILALLVGACSTSRSGLASPESVPAPFDVLIVNGRVLDGTGNPWLRTDVAVRDGRIVEMGQLSGREALRVIDAEGLYVAPGFIDTHSHAGGGLVARRTSRAEALLAQGITTVFINPDGGGPVDLARQRRQLEQHGLGVNVALMIGHGSVRGAVMGMADRAPTEAEMDAMRALVRRGMEDGAYALSSGVFYAPGSFADTRELIELSKVAAEYDGAYQSHVRDESDYDLGVQASIEEVIEIAREAGLPGIVTHIKVLGPGVWGLSEDIGRRMAEAREQGIEVWADQYPYTASSTGLASALVPRWAEDGGRSAFLERLRDPETRARIREGMIENLARRGGAERVQISRTSDESIRGLHLGEIADRWEVEPVDAALRLLERESPGIISFNMQERDVENFMRLPWTMTASDGGLSEMGQGLPHPRGYGSFPRRIREYTRDREVVDLAATIRSMTHLPAAVYRMRDRGMLREGAWADIVVFDLERVDDPATFGNPHHLAQGMVHVLVNGRLAIDNEEFVEQLHGVVLDR